MSQLKVTELDFENIKQNLKQYLQSQDEFSDYNFEGSAMSVLLDTLAYNTHYNAVLAHMLANESFLDSAVKRSSVVSIAKSLGYTPTSKRASRAEVVLIVFPDPAFENTVLTLTRNTQFTSTIDGVTYSFYPQVDKTTILQNFGQGDAFYFSGIEIKEGLRVTNNFSVDANTVSGPFIIPNQGVDTTTLRVRVQNSGTDFAVKSFQYKDKFADVKATDRAWFLEEGPDGLYRILFGDGVVGQKLSPGNIVLIDYLNTNGAPANNSEQFTCRTTITGNNERLVTLTTTPSYGGAVRETVSSIKRNAPRYNSTKERAVTAQDYVSLIKAKNQNIQSVSVWGGEDNDPPIYGKVFISLNPYQGSIITQGDKDQIVTEIIEPRTPIAIQPEFVDPEYLYVGVKAKLAYDVKKTTLTSGQIIQGAQVNIDNYFKNNLNYLNRHLYFSDLHKVVFGSSEAMKSVTINFTLQKRFSLAEVNAIGTTKISFNNKLTPRTLTTNWFDISVGNVIYKVRLEDEPNRNVVAPNYNGSGRLFLATEDNRRVAEVGTIDYDLGKLSLPNFTVISLYGDATKLHVTVEPHDTIKDITTDILTRTNPDSQSAVVPLPAKNTILAKDNSVYNVISGLREGIKIETIARVDE